MTRCLNEETTKEPGVVYNDEAAGDPGIRIAGFHTLF
jgi:hypothetical protein